MFLLRTTLIILLILSLPFAGQSAAEEFIEKYSYSAGESDSKLTCRTFSLLEVKRLLLEKIGTYIESRTELKDFQIEKDEMVALTAGIVKLEILNEKWNGETYILTARIEANPDEIAQAVNDLKNQHIKIKNSQKLQQINEESVEQIREMQLRMYQLQSDLLKLNQDASANEDILNTWGLYEKSVKLRQSGKIKEALETLNTVIRNNPTASAHFERGLAYLEMGKFDEAIADMNETLKAEPNMRGALYYRGLAYIKSGKKVVGRRDIEKAAELGSRLAKLWLETYPPPGIDGGGHPKKKQR